MCEKVQHRSSITSNPHVSKPTTSATSLAEGPAGEGLIPDELEVFVGDARFLHFLFEYAFETVVLMLLLLLKLEVPVPVGSMPQPDTKTYGTKTRGEDDPHANKQPFVNFV